MKWEESERKKDRHPKKKQKTIAKWNFTFHRRWKTKNKNLHMIRDMIICN